jgi:hypothetical protein
MMGGVMVQEVILVLVIVVVTALSIGTLGLFISSLFRTTLAATVLAYAVVLLVGIVLPILCLIVSELFRYSTRLWNALNFLSYVTVSVSPLGAGLLTVTGLREANSPWLFDIGLRFRVPAAWIVHGVIWVTVAAVLLVLTVRRMARQEVE